MMVPVPVETRPPALTLGTYALAPPGAAAQDELDDRLRGPDGIAVEVVEVPLPAAGAPALDAARVARTLDPAWDLLVTCIPRTMATLATSPASGLASTDEDARRAALADVAQVRDLAHALADAAGRPRVRAIAVHSAPGPVHGSLDALEASLAELAGWDLAGAEIVVEHCDALVAGQVPAKGFFTLAEEIAVVARVRAAQPGARLGVGINWGRSAIEGRSAATATAHVRSAARAGVLRALLFSGACASAGAWGPAWADTHIPPRGPHPALAASSGSALGIEEMRDALAAAAGCPLGFVGAKVSVRPTDADVDARVDLARATLALLADALAGGRIEG